MKSIRQNGFTAVESLMIVLVIVVLGAAGYFVWHQDHTSSGPVTLSSLSNSGSKKSTSPTTPSTTTTKDVTLKYSGLQFAYDTKLWNLQLDQSTMTQDCGGQDQATLGYHGASFVVSFSLGQCGKGGGICFDEPGSGCIAQSQELAKVVLSSTKTAYVLAHRTSGDNGKTWQYSLWLSDNATCTDYLCSITITTLQSNPNLISGYDGNDGKSSTGPQTLMDFANSPEVKAASALLQTVHY